MATMLEERPAFKSESSFGGSVGEYDANALRRLLVERTLKRGIFPLASGRRSRMYFNVKTTMMHPLGAALCGHGLLAKLDSLGAEYIGGLEMGAVPLLSVISAFSVQHGNPIPSFFVRKKPKLHGTRLLIEGMDELAGETLAGKRVVLVDDVATSGGSILQAVDQIVEAGGIVSDAIVVIDREEGASQLLSQRGIALHCLFTATELGVTAQDREPLA